MKKQLTLASNDFERFRKPTRREGFLAEMDTVVPWAELAAAIEPYYPQASSAGGRPAERRERGDQAGFGFNKVRYRGLAKNANRLYVTAVLGKYFLVRYTLLGAVRQQ